MGMVEAATLVDHFYPHRGDMELFWRREWWCSSCAPCHSGWKQRLEASGPATLEMIARSLGLPVMGDRT